MPADPVVKRALISVSDKRGLAAFGDMPVWAEIGPQIQTARRDFYLSHTRDALDEGRLDDAEEGLAHHVLDRSAVERRPPHQAGVEHRAHGEEVSRQVVALAA